VSYKKIEEGKRNILLYLAGRSGDTERQELMTASKVRMDYAQDAMEELLKEEMVGYGSGQGFGMKYHITAKGAVKRICLESYPYIMGGTHA
jgi:hypothetical protein